MAPYRDELEAAQRRIDALEVDVEEKAEQIEELQGAVETRDRHLQQLQEKFDGSAAVPQRRRLLRDAAVVAAVLLVTAVFIIQFRPGSAQPPPSEADDRSTAEPKSSGSAAPASTLTLADPPAGGPKGAEPSDTRALLDAGTNLGTRGMLELLEKVAVGHPTEAELRMLRHLCIIRHQADCAYVAHARLLSLHGESGVTGYDEQAKRQDLELKAWSGNATVAEVRMLRAICMNQGDVPCRDRATLMLRTMGEQVRANGGAEQKQPGQAR